MVQQDETHHEARPDLVWLTSAVGISTAATTAFAIDATTPGVRIHVAAHLTVGIVVLFMWAMYHVSRGQVRLGRRIDQVAKASHDRGYLKAVAESQAGGQVIQLHAARSGRGAG